MAAAKPPDNFELPAVYAVRDDQRDDADKSFIVYLKEYAKSKPAVPLQAPCKVIKSLLKLFPLNSYAKVETQNDAIAFLAKKVKRANYVSTDALDQYALAYKNLLSKPQTLADFTKGEENLYFLQRAEAIVSTMNQRLAFEIGTKYAAAHTKCPDASRPTYRRFASICELGYYQNNAGCCSAFSSDIILLSSKDSVTKTSLKKLENLFLAMKSSGYSLQEAVLVTNILAFVQNHTWDAIRPALDNQLRFLAKEGYGQFECKGSLLKRGSTYKQEIAQGSVAQGIATLGKDAIGATVKTAKVAFQALAKGALRLGTMGLLQTSNGRKIETDGDRAAYLLVTHLKTFFNVSKSVYTELVKKIVKTIIYSRVLKDYTDVSIEIAQFLCENAYAADSFKKMTIGAFLNIMSTEAAFVELESSMEPSLDFIRQLIPEIAEIIPILYEIQRVFMSKVTTVIRYACVHASIEVAFNNNFLEWLQHCNLEKHLAMYKHEMKYTCPMAYARLELNTPPTERQTKVNNNLIVFSQKS